jgi:hypothetical protein
VNDSSSSKPESGDLSALPAEIASQSLSRGSIILPVDAALRAIAFLAGRGRRLENWEGWVKMRDGGRAKSLAHSGSFALPGDPARAAEAATRGIEQSRDRWNRDPEYPGATLYVELTFGA